MPAPTVTPPTQQTPARAQYDATADFTRVLNDPSRWVIKMGVPIFKGHQRTDPATGKLIVVDEPKLYRIVGNMQKLERQGGVPIRITMGHTEPGKAETEQPPVVGYYRNPRVQPFGPRGELAVMVDEWLDPTFLPDRKRTPYRSAEYYDDAEQITGVALLTRDPYLDLGVVAYGRSYDCKKAYNPQTGTVSFSFGPPGPTRYDRHGRLAPTMYHLVIGEIPMPPVPNPQPGVPNGQNVPQPAPQPSPQYAAPQPPPQFLPQPPGVTAPSPVPTPYGGSWEMGYNPRQTIPHTHPSEGAVYGRGQQYRPQYGRGRRGYYANEPPSVGGDDMPPGGGGGGGDATEILQAVAQSLQQAQEALMAYLDTQGGDGSPPGGPSPGGPEPPQTPFPPDDQDGGDQPPTGYGPPPLRPGMRPPMGGGMRPPPRPSMRPPIGGGGMRPPMAPRPTPRPAPMMRNSGYGRYENPQAPTPTTRSPSSSPQASDTMPRTISGLPVGYQMRVDRLQYDLQQANEALRVLYYERDQSDTEWCISEIRRLASMGYDVGEVEITELKAKPREQRAAYLQNITTKYQRVPTDMPPPLLGDPTPGHEHNQNRPASREEMDAALKLTSQYPNLDYSSALQYARGQNPTQNRIAGFPGMAPQIPNMPMTPNLPPPEAFGTVLDPQTNGEYGEW